MTKLLIDSGIRNLKEYGYENVTEENILKDYVYSRMFKSILIEAREEAGSGYTRDEIDELIKEIDNADNRAE